MSSNDTAVSGTDAPSEAARVRLETRDLRIELSSSGVDVVSDVSFAVRAGEVLGLVGESGSGKTTVALALLGHARRGLKISGGQINLDGKDILALKSSELRALRGAKVAYVPQDPSAALNPTLRIGLQLREAISSHPGAVTDIDARIREVLKDARLDASTGILKRYPHQLSGGQQQRVALAMAFSCRPSLIVLDEPTTGLDVSTQRHVLETVRALCRSYGVAAVYVSHDLAVVYYMADTIGVMYLGKIVEIGDAESVFRRPAHPYTKGLLDAVPIPSPSEARSKRGVAVRGELPSPINPPSGCRFRTRCPKAQEICAEVEPPMASYDDDHQAACHFPLRVPVKLAAQVS